MVAPLGPPPDRSGMTPVPPSDPIALVRPPGPELERCALTYLRRQAIEVARARAQHAQYTAALERLGVEVIALPRLPQHPDATFVEDAAVVLDELAVIPRMGSPARRGEVESVRAALAAERDLLELRPPAILDGGDVLVAGDVVYVGQSRRTNLAAVQALARALQDHGYMVEAIEVRSCLHLKTACTWIGDDRVLANPRWIQVGRMRGLDVIEVHPEEPFAANVLRVGDTLLVSKSHPRTAAELERLGYAVQPLELDELEKAEAGLTCLSLLFHRRERGTRAP